MCAKKVQNTPVPFHCDVDTDLYFDCINKSQKNIEQMREQRASAQAEFKFNPINSFQDIIFFRQLEPSWPSIIRRKICD